jgi:1-deoxy-D-xylulose-5-phosphate reductoisomerase
VAVFGSTGAIGRRTLDVVERLGAPFRIVALIANRNAQKLAEQVLRFRPDFAALADPERVTTLEHALGRCRVRVLSGVEGMERIAGAAQTDIVVMGLAGTQGLLPVLAALDAGKRVALATKEIIVGFGPLVMERVRRSRAELLPVDSELSAILQCLDGERAEEIRRVILTASGGPFRRVRDLSRVTVEQTLRHPTWRMGRKITVDSASLMNKGLEMIETAYYFGLKPEQVDVLVHPQSIVHSLVEFRDGTLIAQMAMPDMRLPIQYALTYPGRRVSPVRPTRLERIRTLEFAAPDLKRFPCLGLARTALRQGGLKPCVLNSANDIAVRAFLDRRIGFVDIAEVTARTMRRFPDRGRVDLEQLLAAELMARAAAETEIRRGLHSRPASATILP